MYMRQLAGRNGWLGCLLCRYWCHCCYYYSTKHVKNICTQAHKHPTLHKRERERAYSFTASLHNWQTTLNINVFMQLHSEMFIRAYYAREIIMKRTIIVISLCVFCVWMLAISPHSSFSRLLILAEYDGSKVQHTFATCGLLLLFCHRSKCIATNLNWYCYVLRRIPTRYITLVRMCA